jgi:hypothetical protein
MPLLYGRAGRLTAKNAGFRPGQKHDFTGAGPYLFAALLSLLVFGAPY